MATPRWQPERAAQLRAEFEETRKLTVGEDTDRLFKPPIELFRQSVSAYSAGAEALAGLGCRAALENAGFLILAHRPTGTGGWSVVPPRNRADQPLFRP